METESQSNRQNQNLPELRVRNNAHNNDPDSSRTSHTELRTVPPLIPLRVQPSQMKYQGRSVY